MCSGRSLGASVSSRAAGIIDATGSGTRTRVPLAPRSGARPESAIASTSRLSSRASVGRRVWAQARVRIVGISVGVAIAVAVTAAPVTAEVAQCANAGTSGYRAYLAECRSYELVSPSFKDGNQLGGFAISADGSSALEQSKGVYAGTEAAYRRAGYLLKRGASGWEVEAVSPPAARFPAQELLAIDPDLSRTVWAMREPTQSIFAQDLYIRDQAGSFTKIGPMVPPAAAAGSPAGDYEPFGYHAQIAFAGASADLRHVLFTIQGGGSLWPGDPTVKGNGFTNTSLYEYTGTGAASPKLVGVSNDGHLISACQTSLGSSRANDTYNAVSQTGRTVFLTAENGCEAGPEVPELYARLDGVETVPISEPTAGQCSFCQTTTKAPAEFAGASSDGSKALFLTSQELVPGVTGESLFEYDFDEPGANKILTVSAGSPTPEVLGVSRMSSDGSSVYFVARAVLTHEPRGGVAGPCRAELDAEELTEEVENESGRCLPHSGVPNLYHFSRDPVHPHGQVTFVATLAEEDAQDWEPVDTRPVQATPDGDFLAFQSSAGITSSFAGGLQQVYEYDALNGELVRVSRGEAGNVAAEASADSNASRIISQAFNQSVEPAVAFNGLALSNDGKIVVFTSPGALTDGALAASENGADSVFEYHNAGTLQDGEVNLVSDGVNVGRATTIGVTGDGANVFFQIPDALVPQDTDTQNDVYDARVAGGFLPVLAPPECAGEQCRPPIGGSALSPGTPASTLAPPGDNLPPTLVAPGTGAPVRPKPVLTRAQHLARALRVCKRLKSKRRRHVCSAQARRRWGTTQGRRS
jgi:hypothetical protein